MIDFVLMEKSIKDLCHILGGNPAPDEEFFTANGNGIPFVRMKDLGAYHLTNDLVKVGGKLDKNYVQNNRYRIIKKGSILLPRSGSVALNHRAILGVDACIVSHICALEVKDLEVIDNKYLYYYLTSINMEKITKKTTGLDAITFEDLGKIKIKFPKLSIQTKIASILDKADEFRLKDQQLLAKYDELLQGIFYQMFGDLVKNEKGWKIVELKEVLTDVRDGPHVSPKYSDSGIPILSTRNVRPFELSLDEIKYVSPDTYDELTRRFKPQVNDVLLTKGGTTGYAKLVDFNWDFCVWVHLAVLRPNDKIVPKFLEGVLNTNYCYVQSQKYTHGIANRDLGLTRIVKIKIPLPPVELQRHYANAICQIQKQIEIQKKTLRKSETLFKSLLQKAFKGELVK
jgi:type I restriction enzyme, S subunit